MTPDEKFLFESSLESFKNEIYTESYQGFSQLLSLYPREPVFNFIYGASMVMLNTEIKEAFDFLEFAAGKGIGEANFYMGLGYHYLYNFNDAIRFYEMFKISVKPKIWEEYNVERQIEYSKNGKELIKYAYELHVINNKQTSRKNFYYSYDLKFFGGEIIVKTEQFKGKSDKKIDESDLMYISNIQNVVFLSSYGDSRKNSLDLYISRKINSGWSEPRLLPDVINTPFDEAFPFLSEDGNTLYFSSKGHNSIGGYDIFKSQYNAKDNTWSVPKNLDFPINTPFDEIMFASDRYNESAYFASTRTSQADQIGVYRILLEKDPLTRQLANMEDIYQHASLKIDPGAIVELTKRQEIRAESIIDTTNIRTDIAATNDSMSNSDKLIGESFKLLDEKKSAADEFLEYAAAAYKIAELQINEINKINKELNSLKNKNDRKSLYIKDSLNNVIIEKSIIASEMFDFTHFLFNNANQIISLSEYYETELTMLDKISGNEIALNKQSQKLFNEIQKIDANQPLTKYSLDFDNQIINKQNKLIGYKNQLEEELNQLNNWNNKIEIKLELAKEEQNFDVREKYIYDIKTYENNKIDVISNIKELEVQIEFLNYEINQIENRKNIIVENYETLDENLFNDPNLDLTKLNNEIELLKTHISQNSLKELSHKQDKIIADKKYYSQEIDFDSILYVEPELTNTSLDEIMIDTKSYTDKYEQILSENTLKTGDLIFKNDSLKDLIADLETKFDNASTNKEKQEIIEEINLETSEINRNNELITEHLNSQNKVNIGNYLTDFERLKNSSSFDSNNAQVRATEDLISESRNLESDIEDLKIIGAEESLPPILYLEAMKSEIDNLIVEKIENIKANSVIANNTNNDADIFSEIENRINAVKSYQDPQQSQEIFDNFEKVERLYRNAEKENDPIAKNKILTEANRILDLTIPKNVNFLNNNLVNEYAVYNTYNQLLTENTDLPEYTSEYIRKIAELQNTAANLQMQAEESNDELMKMQKLAKAWENLQLANEYYAYVVEIAKDERKYKKDYEIKTDRSTEEFIANIESVERIIPNNDVIVENTQNNTNATVDKLNEIDYQGKVLINIKQQARNKQNIDELSEDINLLKTEIETTNNNVKLENLKSDLGRKEEQQINAIIKYSITTNEILAELDSINNLLSYSNNPVLENLKNEQKEIRESIINYSNFYSADEIKMKHLEAKALEDQITEIYNSTIADTDTGILAERIIPNNNYNNNYNNNNSNNSNNNSNNNNSFTEPDYSIADNYTFDYPYDENTDSEISRLQTKIDLLETEMSERENIMSDMEDQMNNAAKLNEYKKIQKKLKAESKKHLKQIQSWAELNKEITSLQYNFGDNNYSNNTLANNEITAVSDSLKSKSESQIKESIALFDIIITYNAKTADNYILSTYKKAAGLSIEGINMLNAANHLKSEADANDPIILAHYRSVDINETNTNNTNNNFPEIDSSNNVIETTNHDNITATDSSSLAINNVSTTDNNNTNNNSTNNNNTNNNNTNNNNTNNNNTNNNNTNTTDNRYNQNQAGNIFDATAGNYYSDANPIKFADKYNGVYYRIQIGAFNRPIENDKLKGLKPICMEEVPNSVLTRYLAGLFNKFNDAKANLPIVKNMGYTDAFIVAYINGERISNYEARRLEESEPMGLIAANNNSNNHTTEGNINNDITRTTGIFFCVQIGVYATKLGPERLYNLSPLMYHNYAGNLVRHTFGKYYDLNTAINEQNKIRRLGIKDAFVVAYRDGEKISLNEAKALLVNITPANDQIMVNIPDNLIPDNTAPVENRQPTDNVNNNNQNTVTTENAPVIEYYIQIGVFRNDVNNYVKESFRRMAGENQLVSLTNNNMTLYRIGVFGTYQNAQNALAGVISSGVKDAFIVAFVNGKRVNIAQAQALQ